MYRLIAITAADTGARIASIGQIAGEKATVVTALGLSAVMLPKRKALLIAAFQKKAQLEGLLQDQKALESALSFGPVLPAALAPILGTEAEALALLAGHAQRLRDGLRDFGNAVQFQIRVTWDAKAALTAYRQEEDIIEAAKAGGEALRTAMLARKSALARSANDLLVEASLDNLSLPHEHEDVLINKVVLIERAGEAKLDAAVNAIDALLTEALSIKYTGPLPAVSFASVSVEEADASTLSSALKRLGLATLGQPDDVRAAYLARMKTEHPDAAAKAGGDIATHAADYKLLMRVAEAERAIERAGGVGSTRVLLLDLKRDGDQKRAA